MYSLLLIFHMLSRRNMVTFNTHDPENTEAVVQICSVKKVFLEIFQNSQENTFTRDSFLTKLQAWGTDEKKRSLWHRCFPMNFAKFLRTPFFAEHLRWLLLNMDNDKSYLSWHNINRFLKQRKEKESFFTFLGRIH